jgi:hypothetical protein
MNTKPYPAPHCQRRGESDPRMLIVYLLLVLACGAASCAGLLVYLVR